MALTTDESLTDPKSLYQLVTHAKMAQLDAFLSATYGNRAKDVDTYEKAANTYEKAAERLHRPLRALISAFLKRYPGATSTQFLLELKNGRVPSAGVLDDHRPDLQKALADLLEADPNLLDLA